MSIIKRYEFIKRKHKDYVILIVKKDKYYSFGIDSEILNYIGFNGNTNKLQKKSINYLILDNLEIIKKEYFEYNNYKKYEKIAFISKILNKIRWKNYS